MGNLNGLDYGERQSCRVCKNGMFLVERGDGTINDEPIQAVTIRCSRCGTVLDQYQVDWSAPITNEDTVVINDGVQREKSLKDILDDARGEGRTQGKPVNS